MTPMADDVYVQIQSAAAYVCELKENFSIPFRLRGTKAFVEWQPLSVGVLSSESFLPELVLLPEGEL